MKAMLLLLGALVTSTLVGAGEPPQRRALLDGKLTMLVPSEFSLMSDEMRRVKYPGARAPAYVLSNEATTINIAFDQKPVQIKPAELREFEVAVRKGMTGVKFESSGVRKLNGADFVFLVFDSPAIDGTIRNIMTMTSLEGQLLVVSYNCMEARDPGCGALGRTLMESITLKQ